MNRTLGRSHGLARSEILSVVVNRVAKRAFQDVDNLFVVRVAVQRWDVRARGHSQFEHAYARALRSVDEISDAELANIDFGRAHYLVLPRLGSDGQRFALTIFRVTQSRPNIPRCLPNMPEERRKNCLQSIALFIRRYLHTAITGSCFSSHIKTHLFDQRQARNLSPAMLFRLCNRRKFWIKFASRYYVCITAYVRKNLSFIRLIILFTGLAFGSHRKWVRIRFLVFQRVLQWND